MRARPCQYRERRRAGRTRGKYVSLAALAGAVRAFGSVDFQICLLRLGSDHRAHALEVITIEPCERSIFLQYGHRDALLGDGPVRFALETFT